MFEPVQGGPRGGNEGGAPGPEKRDAERSKRAVLDAAQQLFAERGYAGTSMEDVGRAAGVSRGTPGYFFGSKDGLYRAVLDRAIEARRHTMDALAAQARQAGQSADDTIVAFVLAYLDFLAGDSTFLRLVDRESLSVEPRVYQTAPQLDSLKLAIERLEAELQRGGYRHDARQLFITALAVCEWAFVHPPLLAGLGFSPTSPEFLSARKRHVEALIRAWLAAPPEAETRP